MIPFGLVNTLNLFQHFVNNTLRLYSDVFYIAYINNILVYNNNLIKHKKHIYFILEVLYKTSL